MMEDQVLFTVFIEKPEMKTTRRKKTKLYFQNPFSPKHERWKMERKVLEQRRKILKSMKKANNQ